MSFTYKQVSEGRWGIYSGSKLLATVSDRATCETILANFSSGRRDVPTQSPQKTYQATEIDHKRESLEAAHKASHGKNTASNVASNVVNSKKSGVETVASMAAVGKATQMSDAELAQVLNTQSLKVNELESAVLQAQRSQRS